MTIELLFFPGCPNLEAARARLREAFVLLGLPTVWTEIDVSAPHAPPHTKGYGSPTILVNGRDVMGAEPVDAASCRIYGAGDDAGAPPLEEVIVALRGDLAAAPTRAGGSLAAIPAALLAVLPAVSCPACWPAYAGVLGSLGVPFLMRAAWLLPLTAAALLLALVALGRHARQRRGYGPLWLGVAATATIVVGKFALELPVAAYVGASMLVIATLWNAWPRARRAGDCGTCSVASAET